MWPQLFLPQSFREQERILFESDGQFKLSIKIGISDSVHPYPEDFALFEPQLSPLWGESSQT